MGVWMTIQEAYELFIHDRETFAAPATLVKYRHDLNRFFEYIEQIKGSEINNLSIVQEKSLFQDYIIYMRNQNIRPVSIRSYSRSVKAFLKYCYDWDYAPDYLKRVKLPKDDAKPKMPLYRDEVKRIDATFDMNTVLGRRDYCIVHLMIDCGLRRQEVKNLKLNDILWDKNVIQILDSKGNKSRLTMIPDFLLDAITGYCNIAKVKTGAVFRQRRDNLMLTDNSLKQLFYNLKIKTGINRLHAHLLRHTFATSYLLGGGNLEYLRVFLGHSDYSVTKNYAQLAAQMKMLGSEIYQLDPIFFTRGY